MKYATTAFFVLLNLFAQAQTKTWDGGAGTNNWEDANNWNPNGVPSILNDVEIDNDSVSINANQTVKSILLESTHATETNQAIFLQNGVTLSVFNSTSNGLELEDEARFWNAGNLVISNTTSDGLLVNSGTFENMANQGEIYISLCSSGIVNKGTFQNRNNAEVNINDVNFFGFDNNSTSSQSSNRGSITISDGQFGFNNDGTFLNRGVLNIYSSTQIGLVTNNDFQNLSNGVISIDSLQDEGIFASNDFIIEGDLNIKGGLHNGLEDFGLLNLVNSGTIYISKSAENGIEIDDAGSSLDNEVGGEIIIDSTTKEGVLTNQIIINNGEIFINETTEDGIILLPGTAGSILNNGLIHIKNTGEHGIGISDGLFKSEVGAQIIVENTGGSGIFTFKKLINKGSIIIKKSDTYGIHSRDSLVNHGQIEIDESVLAGLFQEEYFLNTSGANLEISNTVNKGVISFDKLVNEGSISINTSGIGVLIDPSNLDSLVNNGSITILRSETNGMEHQGNFFINTNKGEILIDSTGLSGFEIESKFINDGKVTIKRAQEQGLFNHYDNPDSVINNGELNIINSDDGLIHEGANFINGINGEINIDSTEGYGLSLSGRFVNEGNINLENIGDIGMRYNDNDIDTLFNNGLINIKHTETGIHHEGANFINGLSGEIIMDSLEYVGLFLENRFENLGILTIGNVEGNGIHNYVDGSLFNNGKMEVVSNQIGITNSGDYMFNGQAGEIKIDSSSGSSFYNYNRFINEGTLSIKGDYWFYNNPSNIDSVINNGMVEIITVYAGLDNDGNVIINNSCGEIYVEGAIETEGIIKNEGLWRNESISPIDFSIDGSFENDGTFINGRNVQPVNADFINNGNLIYPLIGTLSNGIKEMNVAAVGGSPLHTIPMTWWADEAKTTAAGTYDNVEKTFTTNAAGVSADTLWLELDNGICTLMASISVNQEFSCGILCTATFTGGISTDWHTAENWDIGRVPGPCTLAIIPTSFSCTITTGRKARALRIEAESGAVFDAELGAVLDVNPNN